MTHTKPMFANPIDMLWDAAKTHGTSTALISGENHVSYQGLAAAALVIADRIMAKAAGAKTVAIAVPNSALFVASVFGGWCSGCAVSVHNVLQPASALIAQVDMVKPEVILTTEEYSEKLMDLADKALLIILDDSLFEDTGQLLQTDDTKALKGPTETSLLLFTGGTTGKAKAVEHSFESVMAGVIGMEHAWPTHTGQETWLSISPMFHVYGFLFCVLCPVYAKAINVMGYPFQTDTAITAMKNHQVTVISGGPPAVYAALMANENFTVEAYQGLRICGGGGAPFSEALLQKWFAVTGVPVTEAYGMTEMAPITSNGPADGNMPGSVGKAGVGVEIEIRDHDTHQVMVQGEVGGVYVRGKQCMTGYYNNPDETAAALSGGWLTTGDVGYLSAQGYLFLTGRTKEMINVSGYKVYPREIDDLLLRVVGIAEACTVGVPDERTGEAVVSCLVCAPGLMVSETDVRTFCAENLAAYKVPKHICILEAIPKTPANKQDRLSLVKYLVTKGL